MSKSGNKERIALKKLDTWFQCQKRVLPWRSNPSLYRVWISEIMLQQTQVATVVPYFDRFIRRFPNVKELANAPEQDVMKLWEGLGYYSRARNLHKGAKRIEKDGVFPKTREGWLEVEGVGPYTAGAIMSIALNQPIPILDGNVERVLSRVYRVAGDDRKRKLWEISNRWVQDAYRWKIEPQNFNQAMMELGAIICKPKKPLCGDCPLSDICEAKRLNQVESFPPKTKRVQWKRLEDARICVLNDKGQVLLQKAEEGKWRAGLWDFPSDLKTSRMKLLGEVKTENVVTHHKIKRTTQIFEGNIKAKVNQIWDDFQNPEVPVGAAYQRARKKISALLSLEKRPNSI